MVSVSLQSGARGRSATSFSRSAGAPGDRCLLRPAPTISSFTSPRVTPTICVRSSSTALNADSDVAGTPDLVDLRASARRSPLGSSPTVTPRRRTGPDCAATLRSPRPVGNLQPMRVGVLGMRAKSGKPCARPCVRADDLTLSAGVDAGRPVVGVHRQRHPGRHRLHPPRRRDEQPGSIWWTTVFTRWWGTTGFTEERLDHVRSWLAGKQTGC